MKLLEPHSTIVDATGSENAPWLTMVHAASHDQRFFASQVAAFQQDYRLLLVDLPGHGKSAALPGPYGFEEYALAVLTAMDAAGVDATHYLGSHTGAAVALILATRHPARFSSLALEGPPLPGVDMPSVTEAYQRARATARRRGVEPALAEWFERGPWFEIIRSDPEGRRADAHWAMVSEFSALPWLDATPAKPVAPLLDLLPAIRCPVLIINGEHDSGDFLRAAEEITRHLTRGEHLIVPGAGGFPLWEEPDAVNRRIRAHLQAAAVAA